MKIENFRIGDKVQDKEKNTWSITGINTITNTLLLKNDNENKEVNFEDVVLSSSRKKNHTDLKVTFLKPTFFSNKEEGKVYCSLPFYVNFDSFSNKGFVFSQTLIKNILSKFLNTNCGYRDKIVEFKYWSIYDFLSIELFPKIGSYLHVYHDTNTGKYYRWFDGKYDEILKGDEESVSGRDKFFYKNKIKVESLMYYDEIDGVAKCNENDFFDKKIGQKIAYSNAKKNVYKYINNIMGLLYEKINLIHNDMRYFMNILDTEINNEVKYLKRY